VDQTVREFEPAPLIASATDSLRRTDPWARSRRHSGRSNKIAQRLVSTENE